MCHMDRRLLRRFVHTSTIFFLKPRISQMEAADLRTILTKGPAAAH